MQLSYIISAVRSVADDKKAVTTIEYGVLAALIIVFCIGAITTVGATLQATFTTISGAL